MVTQAPSALWPLPGGRGELATAELFPCPICSQAVIREASAGDKRAAAKRLAALEDMPLLEVNESAKRLAAALLKAVALPDKATEDALHIALAAAHGMDDLLTWNCKHIANAEIRNIVTAVSYEHGYGAPVICTPEELMGE